MLNSLRSLRSPSPAVPMWPRHRMMPHSGVCLLKVSAMQGPFRRRRSHWSNPPPWTQSCAVSPTAPHCRGTWTSPQDRLRCRNTSQTRCCPSSQDNQEKLPAWPQSADTWDEVTWQVQESVIMFGQWWNWRLDNNTSIFYYWHDNMQQLSYFIVGFLLLFSSFCKPFVFTGFSITAFNLMSC